jgi:phospholipase/carboxylesterase
MNRGEGAAPLRVTAVGDGGGPAVLLCHGFGAPGDDLVGLAGAIDAGPAVRWFFPAAPLALPWGGRAWWPIDFDRRATLTARGEAGVLRREVPEGLPAARVKLEETIAWLEREQGVRRDQLVLGGFSQGAMLTTDLALAADAPYAGLVVLSGTLICEELWIAAAGQRGSRQHVFMSHGRRDPLLPIADAEALRAILERSGAPVEWVEHDGQHEIPRAVMARLGAFLRRRFEGSSAG